LGGSVPLRPIHERRYRNQRRSGRRLVSAQPGGQHQLQGTPGCGRERDSQRRRQPQALAASERPHAGGRQEGALVGEDLPSARRDLAEDPAPGRARKVAHCQARHDVRYRGRVLELREAAASAPRPCLPDVLRGRRRPCRRHPPLPADRRVPAIVRQRSVAPETRLAPRRRRPAKHGPVAEPRTRAPRRQERSH
jgi:hypothetical protein